MDTRIIRHFSSRQSRPVRAGLTWLTSLSMALILTACGGGSDPASPDASAGGNVNNNATAAPAASGASDASAATPAQPASVSAASDASGLTPATPDQPASAAVPASDASGPLTPGFQVGTTTFDSALPPEPALPATAQICQSLSATLTAQPNGLLPDSADASDTAPDTTRFQNALTVCVNTASTGLATNKVVRLTSGAGGANAFLSGPLSLPSGVTLWIDQRVTLFASRDPRQFDKAKGTASCGLITASDNGRNALITTNKNSNSAVVGDGTIDGRGGSQLISSVANDPNLLKRPDGSAMSWWDIGWKANVVMNQSQNNRRLIQIHNGSNFTLYRVTLQNAPKFHVVPSVRAGLHGVGREDLYADGRL
jgi:polygalacturonase